MVMSSGSAGARRSSLAANPFLILGVPASADMKVIQQVGQRAAMQAKLAGDGSANRVERVEAAIEQLKDPVERMRWGVLWLQLSDEGAAKLRADPALSRLSTDPLQDGAAAWRALNVAESKEVHSHNLGVLLLIEAEARTAAAQGDTPDDMDDDLECVPLWNTAFLHLAKSFGSERFWSRQRLAAKAMDDPRLKPEHIDQLQVDTARRVLAFPANVIQTALMQGHAPVAKAYVQVMQSSGFDRGIIDDLLSGVYQPLADRVESVINRLSDELGRTVGSREAPFASLLRTFEREALPDLRVMLNVGDLPGYAEEHARDTSAEFLRNFGVKCWNEADADKLSAKAVKLAAEIVDSDSLRSKIADDQRQIAEISEMRPVSKAMEQAGDALQRGDPLEALQIVRRAHAGATGLAKTRLGELLDQVKHAHATQLYNSAGPMIELGRVDLALANLREALQYEPDPSDRRLIQQAISAIEGAQTRQSSSSGCLVFLTAPIVIALGAMAIRAAAQVI